MHAVGRPSRHSPPAAVALATSPGVGAGPRRGRLGVRVRLAERGVRLVSEGGRQGKDSATFRKKRRRILSSSKRRLPEINTKPTSSPNTPPTKPPTLTRTLQAKAAPATS
ncbi:cytoplasmic protein [Cryptococcus neoformans Tu259-1]|uniref:Cytoplasmic protein n=1 Tax=Cryptococcus neoformans Tu259-1 TaxID=1230072 RepID=A0A854QCH8_CRYNE|nr:cytoplasmic protein [Cryptococcus neoformans var. grubii Tu259-1]